MTPAMIQKSDPDYLWTVVRLYIVHRPCLLFTGSIKAGFGADLYPQVRLRTLVSRGKRASKTASHIEDVAVGDACLHMQDAHIARPMKAGLITNWDDMETIWRHLFSEHLKVSTISPL
jgi:actin-related protein